MLGIFINGTEVTKYIDQSSIDTYSLNREVERGLFEVVVGDVHLKFIDRDDVIKDLLTPIVTAQNVKCVIEADRPFYGYVDMPSVVIDPYEKSVTMDVFSMTKQFWDVAKTTQILTTPWWFEKDKLQWTVQEVLQHEIVRPAFAEFISATIEAPHAGVDAGIFSTELIRAFKTVGLTDAELIEYGVEGNYGSLDPSMTVADLLKKLALFFNAEFDYDGQCRLLYMRGREAIQNDAGTAIDDIVLQSESIVVRLVDDKKYDYIYSFFKMPRPPQPEFERYDDFSPNSDQPGFKGGRSFSWVVVGMVNDQMTEPSEPMTVYLPDDNEYYHVHFRVLTHMEGTTERRIYRTAYHDPWHYYFWYTIPDNTTNPHLIDYGNKYTNGTPADTYDTNLQLQPVPFRGLGAWLSYSESSGWNDPLYDIDGQTSRPRGRILDVRPQLRFRVNDTDDQTTDDPYYSYRFFRGKRTFTSITENDAWRDVLRVRRRLECTIDSTAFDLGDTITAVSVVPNDFTETEKLIIRSMKQNLHRETTRIEALTL